MVAPCYLIVLALRDNVRRTVTFAHVLCEKSDRFMTA